MSKLLQKIISIWRANIIRYIIRGYGLSGRRETIVAFDFDKTLVSVETGLHFIRYTIGFFPFVIFVIRFSPQLIEYAINGSEAAMEKICRFVFGKRRHADLVRLGESYCYNFLPKVIKQPILDRLKAHLIAGAEVYIVSRSLSFYLEPWCASHGITGVFCTRLEFDSKGLCSGKMVGKSCNKENKALALKKIMRDSHYLIAYGDSDGDIAMLSMAHEAYWVKGIRILPFYKKSANDLPLPRKGEQE